MRRGAGAGRTGPELTASPLHALLKGGSPQAGGWGAEALSGGLLRLPEGSSVLTHTAPRARPHSPGLVGAGVLMQK